MKWETKLQTKEVQKQLQDMFLGKGVLKVGNKFTGEDPCQNAISIKLQSCTLFLWALTHRKNSLKDIS